MMQLCACVAGLEQIYAAVAFLRHGLSFLSNLLSQPQTLLVGVMLYFCPNGQKSCQIPHSQVSKFLAILTGAAGPAIRLR